MNSRRLHGAGVRVFNGLQGVYVYTNDTSLEGLLACARRAASAVKAQSQYTAKPLMWKETPNIHFINEMPDRVKSARKVEKMKAAQAVLKEFNEIVQASVGYMDGLLDDGSAPMKKCRYIALLGPLVAIVLWIPNMLTDEELKIKIIYTLLWIPATFSSYYNLKHAIIPDMGFGFVRAIRPFNIAALSFTYLQLIHLTLWSYCDWLPLLISGIVFGSSCLAMVITTDRGVKKWVL